jgi:outer membrane autotransporter protein
VRKRISNAMISRQPDELRHNSVNQARRLPTDGNKTRLRHLLLASVSAAALTALSAGSAEAQNTWTGATNNDWTVPNNWTVSTVPTAASTVHIDTGSAVLGVNGAAVGVSTELDVGSGGGQTGTLTIQNGSTLTNSTTALIASVAASTGVVTVTGAGTLWQNTGIINVGWLGNGTLNVQNGGRVLAPAGTTMDFGVGSAGTLNINSSGTLETNFLQNSKSGTAQANFDNGILKATASNATFINGFTGTQLNLLAGGLTIDTAGFSVSTDATSAFTGSGGLTVTGGGAFTLLANNPYTGATSIQSGSSLVLQGAGAIASSSRVIANGTFNVSGVTPASANIQSLAGGGAVVLGAKNLTITNANDVFSGVISGTGGLTVTGGAQTLAGANTYTGGTTISAGTLQIGNGGTGGQILGNVTNNASLAFNRSDALNMNGVISGTGAVNQIGSGTTFLNAANTYTGATSITGGTLSVNGSIANSALTVRSGGTLGGNGTVGVTTVQSGGTIAPGNSIGTIHINGAFTQAAGSVYQVQADPNSNASDLIAVTGPATLQTGAGLTVVKAVAGPFRPGTTYTVLTASGGVTGTYTLSGDTTTASAFLGLRDSYNANNVFLTVVQIRDPAQAALTFNQHEVAISLPVGGALNTAILNLPSDAAARSAFDQLSGEPHASIKGALLTNGQYVRTATFDRLRDVLCRAPADIDPHSPDCGSDRLSVWMQGFGGWGNAGSGQAAGLDHSTAGVLIGADVPVANWRVGVFGGYGHSDYSGGGANADSDDYHFGLYGGTRWDALVLSLGGSYTWNNITTNRAVSFGDFSDHLRAKYNGTTAQAFAELGYQVRVGPAIIEPFASVGYIHLHTGGFAEAGGPAALTSGTDSMDDAVTTLGIRPSSKVMLGAFPVTVRGMIGWQHTLGVVTTASTMSFAGGSPFRVTGAPIARDAAALEAGIDLAVRNNVSVGLSYGGQFSSGTTDQTARGTVRISF